MKFQNLYEMETQSHIYEKSSFVYLLYINITSNPRCKIAAIIEMNFLNPNENLFIMYIPSVVQRVIFGIYKLFVRFAY